MARLNAFLVSFLAGLGILFFTGCSSPTSSEGEHEGGSTLEFEHRFTGQHPIKIVCTTGMVADLARNIGGEHVEVTALMGAGVDPHLYKASPGDLSLFSGADIAFFSGLHLEGKMRE